MKPPTEQIRFSERDEEDFILPYFKATPRGFFVEIGANNGWKGSNCYALYLAGWTGVCVEAGLDTFKNLALNYAEDPRVQCIWAAVWNQVGLIDFSVHNEVEDSGLSRVGKTDQPSLTNCLVPCMTLDDLFARCPAHIDFLSIDAEGCDFYILAHSKFGKRPTCIMVEHTGRTIAEFEALLSPVGYKLAFSNEANAAFVL